MICVSHSKMRSESAKSRLTFLQHNNQQRLMLTAADALIPPLIIRVDMVIMIVLLSSASLEAAEIFSSLSKSTNPSTEFMFMAFTFHIEICF